MPLAAIIPPADCTMAELEQAAIENDMYLITDGCRLVVSQWVPPGWHRMGITHRLPPAPRDDPQAAVA